jgi:hypothetical protein
MTPAQASGITVKGDWHNLVKEATKEQATKKEPPQQQLIEVTVK